MPQTIPAHTQTILDLYVKHAGKEDMEKHLTADADFNKSVVREVLRTGETTRGISNRLFRDFNVHISAKCLHTALVKYEEKESRGD